MQKPSFSIYNASAGSGKTYALVKEYLRIILTSQKNDAYRNILAITFTNKAVHEMKSRIVGNLSQFASDDPNQKTLSLMLDLASEIKMSVAEIKQKSQQIIKHIIHNYAAFDISTIDKFTHRVIRTFAHDLQLPMSFEVSLDTENLLAEAVDALIAQAGEDPTLTRLLIDFTMEKADDDKSWDVSREILDTGRLLLNENYREEIDHFKTKTIDDFTQIKTRVKLAIRDIETQYVKEVDQIFQLLEKNKVDLTSFSSGYFPKHLERIKAHQLNNTHKRHFKEEDISIKKAAKDKAIIESLLPEIITQMQFIYANYEKKNFFLAFLKNITPLSLLNRVSQEFTKIQKEQNILSIAEFNAIIYNEIQSQPAPFIYERLGERYKHFFIDEFQDTSQMQWQNLIPLIDNALSSEDLQGEKGTLMIVGDPKQSIYRWRGGKAEQFIDLSKDENPFANPDKKVIPLGKNFRSYSQVVTFNNQFFRFLSGEFSEKKYQELYEKYSWQDTNDKIGGYVNISFISKIEKSQDEDVPEKAELYLQKVLATILQAQNNGFDYSEIVVVVRRNKDGVLIANYLTEQNIPIQSSETLLLANTSDIKIIIHILKYLNNPSDLEAKAFILQYLASDIQTQMPIHDFIAAGMEIRNEKEFETWLQKLDIELSFDSIRKKSLYEATEIIIKKFLKKTYNAYIQFFLDIVLERDMKYQSGISDFLNYWNKNSEKLSIPSPENTEAIRIISIHKSKGLEFPVVIFPFADEDYNRQPKDKIWLDSGDETIGLEKVLVENNKAVEQFSESASMIFQQKNQERLLDNINVLYVALTRAEEQLYVISQYQEINKSGEYPDNLASFFITYLQHMKIFEEGKLEYDFGSPQKISLQKTPVSLPKSIEISAELLDFENIKIAQREALMWGSHQQSAIEYGNIIHEILSLIHTSKDIDTAVEKSITNGLIATTTEEVVKSAIEKIVFHPDLKEYFSDDSIVLNEKIIIRTNQEIAKPDRIIINPQNEVLLLDYKTGIHRPEHKKQLEMYTETLESMQYKVIRKALVYIGESIQIVNF